MSATLTLSTATTAIAIVDDDVLTREATVALLAKRAEFEVVASVSDVGALSVHDGLPDVILIDVRHRDGNSALNPSALVRAAGYARIIATGVSTESEQLVDLIRLGVSGFVLKGAQFAELVSTIRAVAAGTRVLPPCLLTTLVQNIAHLGGQRAAGAFSAFHRMTPHQREIVMLIANGKSNKEIAAQKNISPNTAKTHVRNIMMKLSMHTRLQIAAQANEEHWTLENAG